MKRQGSPLPLLHQGTMAEAKEKLDKIKAAGPPWMENFVL